MVEEPECHRVGAAHCSALLGRRVTRASSPGKFAEGAAAIEGKALTRIEVHGKALFYFFEDVVVYVHFGMAGAFESYAAGEAPAARPTTRLALAFAGGASALLSAMTVVHGTEAGLYVPRSGALGPDPLRDDADCALFAAACAGARKKTIAAVLLDQSKLAGVGNILRSEICAHAGVHPSQLAATLPPGRVAALWETTRAQMLACYETGSIWDPVRGAVVYGRASCCKCGGRVETWRVNGRALYACKKHQQMDEYGGEDAHGTAKSKAKNAGRKATNPATAGAVRKRSAPKATTATAVRKRTAPQAGAMASAGAARAAKRARGEALNRQHTALKDGATRAAEGAERAAKEARVPGRSRGGRSAKGKDGAAAPATAAARAVAPARGAGVRRSGRLRARCEAEG